MNKRLVSKTDLVTVTRSVKDEIRRGQENVWGPMTLSRAIKDGHLTTSRGTVRVVVQDADGNYISRYRDGHYYAQTPDLDFDAFIASLEQ